MKRIVSFLVSSIALTCLSANAEVLMGPGTKDNPNVDVALGYINTVWIEHKPVEGYEKYVDLTQYIHYPGGVGEANPPGLATFLKGFPDFKYDVKQVFADGDYVITHSLLTGVPGLGSEVQSPQPGSAPKPKIGDEGVDIFLIKNGKIVKQWDIIEPAGGDSAADGEALF